jgi:hypothetical protein
MHEGAKASGRSRWPSFERRHAGRIPYGTHLRFRNQSGAGTARVRDVSTDGLFLEAAPDFRLGDRLALHFRFRYAREAMMLNGEIIRLTPEGVAVRLIW